MRSLIPPAGMGGTFRRAHLVAAPPWSSSMSPATHLSTRLAARPKSGLPAAMMAGAADWVVDATTLMGVKGRRGLGVMTVAAEDSLVAMILADSAGWVVDATIVVVARARATIVTLVEAGDSRVRPVVVIVGAEALMTTTHATAPLLLQMPCLTSRGRI